MAPAAGAARTRVVVTGLGVISSIGTDPQAFARSLRAGRCSVAPIRSFPTEGYPYAHATEVQDLGALQGEYERLTPRLGRASAFAVLAARQAVADAGLDAGTLERAQAGVLLGSTNGESQQIDAVVRRAMFDGALSVPPGDWAGASAGRIAGAVADDLGLPGSAMVLATACAGSNYAIGAALDAIRDGEAEVMLCGGVDAVCRWTYSAFFRIGAVTPDVPRPFDRDRRGLLTGEGAGVLLLESREHALARGARIWAEVLGYATNCDARHMVAPDRDSVARCMRLAQADAGIVPQQVDYVSAHGTGTRANDVTESGAIRDVFGAHAPPLSSIKSMMGHTMGAANVMGALACLVGMDQDFLPPTAGFRTPDPECDIDCVPNQARPAHIRVAQNNGFGFGGNNAIVVLARHAQEAAA